jgi:hypothetical protein
LTGAASQTTGQTASTAQVQAGHSAAAKPAEALYLQLRKVGLDPARTYHVREAALDWPGLHFTLEDGEISFTRDVAGKITGAFFEGDGEVLLAPPNTVERASMALFTGMAILEDRFSTAYFRFNDDLFGQLQAHLRPTPDAEEFASRWNESALHLSELDAMRLLVNFSKALPVAGKPAPEAATTQGGEKEDDRFLHARIEGPVLGAYDLFYDGKAYESVVAGQTKTLTGMTFYDIWTSFRPGESAGRRRKVETPPLDEVEIKSYKISTRVNPPTSLSADAVLKMSVRRGGARTLLFELSRFLQVKQVEVNGQPVEFINNPALEGTQLARRGNDEVAVVFDEPLQQGQELSVRFVYGGDVLSEAGGGLLYVGARGAWYPSRGLVPCEYELNFSFPAGWTLIATGKRVEGSANIEADEGAHGERHAKWVTERPIALAGFNLGKYERASTRVGKVEVDTYAARGVERTFPRLSVNTLPPPDMRGGGIPAPPGPVVHAEIDPSPARNAQAVADEAAQALSFFSGKFGPYPYSSLELTQMPGSASQGWPGLIFLSSMSFLSPTEAAGLHMSEERSAMRKLMLPHETAHQWWGDLVLWRSYRDQWLVEALANYSALMMAEKESPTEFRQVLESYRADLQEKNKDGEPLRSAGPVTLGQRLNSSHFPTGYEAISYGRGTWLFHMLRYMLLDGEAPERGTTQSKQEEPFVRALRKVCERYAGRPISTEELMAVFAEELPPSLQYEKQKSLDWFIDSWVQGTALPHFSLRAVRFTTKGKGSIASGTIVEKEAPDDLVTSVPIYAVVGGRNVLLGRVFADGPETSFHLSAPQGANKVVIDPYGTLLTSRR